jgi:hypothetical protein
LFTSRARQLLILGGAWLALLLVTAPAAAAGAPSFGTAASRGMQALLGNGKQSVVAWDPKTGLWGGHIQANWWQSALAVTTLVRYAERVRSTAPIYQHVLTRTYQLNIYKPHATARREFANQFMDDTGWWGLAWLAASQYELYFRGDRKEAAKFLSTAEWDARYIAQQPRPCGGIPWSIGTPPDTVSNAEFIALTAGLARYRLAAGPFYNPSLAAAWRSDAESALSWLESSGLIKLQTGSVLDSLNGSCHVIGGSLTYTEGEVAEALTQMGAMLGDSAYYQSALAFLEYAINPASGLTSDGILREHCEATAGACGQVQFKLDLPAYKGLFVNALADWSQATRSGAFNGFLRAQANAVINNALRGAHNNVTHCATPATCEFAFHWSGEPDPSPLGITLGGQESGLDALTAVLPTRG